MTILVPTDFSAGANAALHYASVLAQAEGDDLLLVYVKPASILPRGDEDVADPAEPGLHQQMEHAHPDIVGIECRRFFLRGNPADEILKVATGENVNMIVMGTHGQTDSPTVAVGAIAQSILNRAKCAVLTVKRAEWIEAACG